MSAKEIQTEMDYRVFERIGSLAEDREPTAEQRAMAISEAEAWRKQWLLENVEQRELL